MLGSHLDQARLDCVASHLGNASQFLDFGLTMPGDLHLVPQDRNFLVAFSVQGEHRLSTAALTFGSALGYEKHTSRFSRSISDGIPSSSSISANATLVISDSTAVEVCETFSYSSSSEFCETFSFSFDIF
jgi:hypothetical protein